MINPKCFSCLEELKEYGAILISPPNNPDEMDNGMEASCFKYHFCKECSDNLIQKIYNLRWSKKDIKCSSLKI